LGRRLCVVVIVQVAEPEQVDGLVDVRRARVVLDVALEQLLRGHPVLALDHPARRRHALRLGVHGGNGARTTAPQGHGEHDGEGAADNDRNQATGHGRFWKNRSTSPVMMASTMTGSTSLSTLRCGMVALSSGFVASSTSGSWSRGNASSRLYEASLVHNT